MTAQKDGVSRDDAALLEAAYWLQTISNKPLL